MYSIYALTDPRTEEVRYVGKAQNPAKRLRAHLNVRGISTRLYRWIASLRSAGSIPGMVVLEVGDGLWQEAERRWIAHYRGLGSDLCNHTAGGEGLVDASEETRQKLREYQLARQADPVLRAEFLSIIRAPERCAKISEALRNKPKAAEHVKKLPQNCKGFVHSAEFCEKQSRALMGNTRRRGKKLSLKTRLEISNSMLGNKNRRGKKNSAESNLKRSASQKGVPKSEEWKRKARIAALKRWQREREEKLEKARPRR